jgi:opacity protein-like surface antigen
MKMLKLAAVAAFALSGLTAAPALAQPGHDNNGRDMRHNAGGQYDNGNYDNDHHDNGNHYGWRNHHRHQTCHYVWRHHHRERQCSWNRW